MLISYFMRLVKTHSFINYFDQLLKPIINYFIIKTY